MGERARPLTTSVRFKLALACGVAVGTLGLTACSSSSHSSSPGGNTNASQATSITTAPSQGSGGSSGTLEAATKVTTALLQRPTTLTVPALPSKPPTGKTVDMITCGAPSCQSFVPLARAAFSQVGWNLVQINSGLTPQTVDAAYDQAVRNKPAGIIGTGGVDPNVFAHQLSELKAENVPVVLLLVSPSRLPGVTAEVLGSDQLAQYSTDLADYVLSTTNAQNAHVLVVKTPATPSYNESETTFTSTLTKGCSSCTVDTFSFPETAVGTTLPSMIVSYLRTHPSINYLDFDWGDMALGVPSALQQAGLSSHVKLITQGIDQPLYSYLQAGQVTADLNDPWYEAMWNSANLIFRYDMGLPLQPAEQVQLPGMIVTKDNLIPGTNSFFPNVANYQQVFDQAWHVSP